MKQVVKKNKEIVIICLLLLVSIIIVCVREGNIKFGISAIWLLVVISIGSVVINVFNYKIQKALGFQYMKRFSKYASYIWRIIIIIMMLALIVEQTNYIELFIIQVGSSGIYIGLCMAQKYYK